MKKQLFLPLVLFMVLMISSCNGDKVDGLQRKVDSLNLAIKKLSVEKAKMAEELSGYKNSPENLCADIEQLLKTENLSKLVKIQRQLKKYHPACSQLQTVNEYIQNVQEIQQKRKAAEKAKRMQAVNILRKKYDDVSGMTWFFSKKAKSTGTYCQLYLGKSDSGGLVLRMEMQYHGESWIFFEQAYLSYDGNTKEIVFDKYKDKETEVSGGVWEWIDVNVDDDISFIRKMVNGKNVKWRLDGRYTETRKFSAQELAGMKEVLLAYDVLKNGL